MRLREEKEGCDKKEKGEMLANILFAFMAVFAPHSLCGRGTSLRASLTVETRFSRGACARTYCNSSASAFIRDSVNNITRCTQAALYRRILACSFLRIMCWFGPEVEDYITS